MDVGVPEHCTIKEKELNGETFSSVQTKYYLVRVEHTYKCLVTKHSFEMKYEKNSSKGYLRTRIDWKFK